MHDHQMIFLIKLWADGNEIQSFSINEPGDMTITFFDKGGNFHDQTLTADGKLRTNE
jgi:hypothetical protein